MYFLLFFFQADSLKKSLKGSSGNGGGGCSLDSKMQQVKELEEEVTKVFSSLPALVTLMALDESRA